MLGTFNIPKVESANIIAARGRHSQHPIEILINEMIRVIFHSSFSSCFSKKYNKFLKFKILSRGISTNISMK